MNFIFESAITLAKYSERDCLKLPCHGLYCCSDSFQSCLAFQVLSFALIVSALLGFSDFGHSVTPSFLLRNRFY